MHTGKNLYCLREYLNHYKWTVGRNMDIKATADKTEGMNEQNGIGNWRKRVSLL